MKKILLSCCLVLGMGANAQIFKENFDGDGPGIAAWTKWDLDGLTPNYSFITEGWNAVMLTGESNLAAVSTSWYTTEGTPSNDWLISPSIAISGTTPTLYWKSRSSDVAPYQDGYKVMLSTNGGATPADFTVTLYTIAADTNTWKTNNVNLTAYKGQNVKIAFVNNSLDKNLLLIDDISISEPVVASVPNCATLTTPANGATNVAFGSTALAWTAPTTGTAPTGYKVYFGLAPTSLSLLTTTAATATGVNINGTAANTTYYWRIVPTNATGDATGCVTYSLTTKANDFLPYCAGGLTFTGGVEPITSVILNDMTNISSASTTGAVAHENFISKVATLEQGKTYPITFEGNTVGTSDTDRFIVFVDWNQDGDFADAGETYFGTAATAVSITGSTGADGKKATGNIQVPAGATLGNTRMRVKKNFGGSSLYLSPCYSSATTANATTGYAGWGQAEDYTINVVSPVMGVSDLSKADISVYPNPFTDVLKISDVKGVKSVSVNDISGREVKSLAPSAELNLSSLKAGLYIVNLKMEDGSVKTFKAIKK